MSIADRIRRARLHAGMSQSQLAQYLGVTRSACSQWETEHGTAPRRHRLEQLAELCGVSYEWLATGRTPQGVAEHDGVYRSGLKADERELLQRYERLGSNGRKALLTLLRTLERGER